MNLFPGPGLQASGKRNGKRARVNSNMDTDFGIQDTVSDRRRMDLISGRQFRHRALALQRLQRHPRLERRVMVPAF